MSRRVAALLLGVAVAVPSLAGVPCGGCDTASALATRCCCPTPSAGAGAPGTTLSKGCCGLAPAPASPPQAAPAALQKAPPRPDAAIIACAAERAPAMPAKHAGLSPSRDPSPFASPPGIFLLDCSLLI